MTGVDREYGKAAETVVEATPSERAEGLGVQTVYVDGSAEPNGTQPLMSLALLLVFLGVAAMVGLMLIIALRAKSSSPGTFQDLGAGISNATGLRGNLKARWQDKAAQYQLKLEPIDPMQSAGFAYVAANPPAPLFVHVKLLDATGFTVCGKDILFPFDGPGEQDRERGQDIFQKSIGDDGAVVAVTAQGTVPCTAEQYKQIVYWDFSTNFPTLAEQVELMNHTAELKARQEAQKHATLRRQKAPRSAFYTEGDDRVTGYDARGKVLQTGFRDFLVTGSAAQSTASVWAANSVLFHYKCDQRSRCVLKHAGGTDSLTVVALQ